MRAQHVQGDKARLVADYVAETTGAKYDDGLYVAYAILNDDNDFCGGVILSNYRGTDIEVSVASETPIAWHYDVCRTVFNYIFNGAKCVRCTCITTKRNKRAREFLDALGFVLEGNLRRGYDGQRDALIYGLLAEDCRFLAGGLDGEEVGAEGAAAA